ncbi:Uncharacterized protein FWK35_00027976 [Aphis craccivora]|uniref:Uncharacterized protein n=1 Tax=Aphis craccivora TaxID=307492 RepID=A0A6G0YK65_APHCR|nr:Uncharacterized protein FWK35_00027976 [Aphis craccivora]
MCWVLSECAFKQLIRNLFLNYNHTKKSIWLKTGFAWKLPFFLNFFLNFPRAFENYWKFQKMTSSMHQIDSFCYRKPPPKFENEALFQHVLVYTDTQKKNTKHYNYNKIICKSHKTFLDKSVSCGNYLEDVSHTTKTPIKKSKEDENILETMTYLFKKNI